jgi:sporulation integral membrane protein YtvI
VNEKRQQFIINILYYAIICVIIGTLISFSLKYLMPFIIGFFIALLLKPIVSFIHKNIGHNRKIISIIIIIIVYLGLFFIVGFGVMKLITILVDVFIGLPDYYNHTVLPFIATVSEWLQDALPAVDEEVNGMLSEYSQTLLDSIGSIVSSLSQAALGWITGIARSIPSIVASIFFIIISSVFFVLDFQKIVTTLVELLPKSKRPIIFEFKNTLYDVIFKYLKSYFILMSMTFVELSIGLTLLKVENAIGLAFLIALVDILPVLGTGSVMIPWAVLTLFQGDVHFAAWLFLIYIFITVVRNVVEPKVLSTQIGLHPLVTLVSMYVGARLFGVGGLFGFPISIAIITILHKNGSIKIIDEFKKYIEES